MRSDQTILANVLRSVFYNGVMNDRFQKENLKLLLFGLSSAPKLRVKKYSSLHDGVRRKKLRRTIEKTGTRIGDDEKWPWDGPEVR